MIMLSFVFSDVEPDCIWVLFHACLNICVKQVLLFLLDIVEHL